MATSATSHQAPDAADVYALGSDAAESARLQRQSDELRPEAVALIDKLGLHPGQSAIDVGCGPSGIVALLAETVGPGGRTVGLDANPLHIARVRELIARTGLSGVELLTGDARDTGLATGSFDLVHARTLLVTIPEPAEVLAEMVRLAKPGGWVASQEPDSEFGICYRRWRHGPECARSSGADSPGQAPTFRSAGGWPRCTGWPDSRRSA